MLLSNEVEGVAIVTVEKVAVAAVAVEKVAVVVVEVVVAIVDEEKSCYRGIRVDRKVTEFVVGVESFPT